MTPFNPEVALSPGVDRHRRREVGSILKTAIRCRRLVLGLSFALRVVPAPAYSAGAGTHGPRDPETLVLDAAFTRVRSAGPDASHVGHRQIVTGILRNAAGREVGRLSFACIWIRILTNGDALEHCSGHGQTADGKLDFAGRARESDRIHTFAATGGTGRYHSARGTITDRDLASDEALISATLRSTQRVRLTVATAPRPPANRLFLQRANRLCRRAAEQLAALPPFPYPNFDPLHPDPALLPEIGAFFTGRGDPRPTLRELISALTALGTPPAIASAWKRVLNVRDAALDVIAEQDTAALAGNVRAFVKSVHDSSGTFRQIAITATVFGTTQCVL